MSFSVAGVALRDILKCLRKCRKSLCVTDAILWQGFQKMTCMYRGRRGTLETSIVILHGMRSTLDVSCCVFYFATCVVRVASSGDNVQIAWQAWGIVRVSFCMAGAVFGTLSSLRLLLSALARLCEVQCCFPLSRDFAWQAQYLVMLQVATLDSALPTLPKFPLCTLHSALYTLHFALHTLHSTLRTLQTF